MDTKSFIFGAGATTLLCATVYGAYKGLSKLNSNDQHVVRCAGLEMGGTSCVIAIGEKTVDKNGRVTKARVIMKHRIKTQTPEVTTEEIIALLKDQTFDEVGIASFGPLCLDKSDLHYGFITTTPKPAWGDYPIYQSVKNQLPRHVRHIGFETDVNAAAMAEFYLGGHNIKQSLAYITVGTGVGVGLIVNGKPLHGALHPEGGHVFVKLSKLDEENKYQGICPFHKCCVEGMVSNNSIAARKNCTVDQLPYLEDDDPVWESIGAYLGQLCMTIACIASPEVIIIGGGVMKRKVIMDYIRQKFVEFINGYLKAPKIDNVKEYIKEPTLGEDVGALGAFCI